MYRHKKVCLILLCSLLFSGTMTSYAAEWTRVDNVKWRVDEHTHWLTDDGYIAPYGSWHELYGNTEIQKQAVKFVKELMEGNQNASCKVKTMKDMESVIVYIRSVLGISNGNDEFTYRKNGGEYELYLRHGGSSIKKIFEKNIKFCESLIPKTAMSALEKVRHIENTMKEKLDYDYTSENATLSDAISSGKTKCCGFASAEYLACLASGIPAKYVIGKVSYGEGDWRSHAWLEVFVDGKWVMRDPTGTVIYYENSKDCYEIGNEQYQKSFKKEVVF